MLKLTRKVGERIIVRLGEMRMTIELVQIISTSRAQIGIKAPAEVIITREELLSRDDRGDDVRFE